MLSRSIAIWILMLLPSGLAAISLLAAVYGYVSTSFALGPSWHDSANLTALVRLYFIYSLLLNLNAAWLISSAILWPIVHTRRDVFHKSTSRSRWRKVSLLVNGTMLPLIIVFGACALAYASKRIYDDAVNGWIEGQAPIYALLIVLTPVLIAANWVWQPNEWRDEERGDKEAFARSTLDGSWLPQWRERREKAAWWASRGTSTRRDALAEDAGGALISSR